MRFGLIHRLMTDALAALGVLALVTSGELDRLIGYGCVIGLCLALVVPDSLTDSPMMRRFGVVAPLALFGMQVARLASGGELLPVAVEFAAGLQVIRLATRRGAAHDQQVIVLALIHLIAGTVLGSGLAYGLCFLGFLVVAPGALVLSHLRREVEGNYRQGARDRTGLPVDVPRILRSRRVIGRSFLAFTCLLSLPIFLFTALLFVLFPRVGLSLLLLNHARPERMVGFSDRVDLGGVGKLRTDPTIVLRVDVPNLPPTPPPRLALYLKGTAFDRYNGRSWQRTQPAGRTLAEQRGREVRILRYAERGDTKLRIELERIDPAVVFLPTDAVALTVVTPVNAAPAQLPEIFVAPEGGFTYRSPDDRGLRYEVSMPGPEDVRLRDPGLGAERARYLALPANLPARIPELARTWAQGTVDPVDQAQRIEARLRRDYKYDLDSPSGSNGNPLDHFLFVSKRGHCEFYSTAMAVMLRSLGVPARNVTGFIGGTYNRFSRSYAVRQGDAHSWVEAYLPGRGWSRFDPTPPTSSAPRSEIHGLVATVRDMVEAMAQRWNRHVVNYDLKQQVGLLRNVRDQYRRAVTETGSIGRMIGSPRRAAIALLTVFALALIARAFLKRRKTVGGSEQRASGDQLAARRIVELYRALELALIARGVPRPSGTPPLLHAQNLVAMGHPVAEEALALTDQYVRVRFGGESLSEADKRHYAERVRALRHPQKEAQAAA